MKNSGKNYFLLIVSDTYDLNERVYPAYLVLKYRLNNFIWALYKGTILKASVKKGDKLLFYIAGKKAKHGRIVAEAEVKQVESYRRELDKIYQQEDKYIPNFAEKFLLLEKIKYFDEPIVLKNFLGKLSFISKKKKKWGVYLQGGIKRLEKEDFKKLTSPKVSRGINLN